MQGKGEQLIYNLAGPFSEERTFTWLKPTPSSHLALLPPPDQKKLQQKENPKGAASLPFIDPAEKRSKQAQISILGPTSADSSTSMQYM